MKLISGKIISGLIVAAALAASIGAFFLTPLRNEILAQDDGLTELHYAKLKKTLALLTPANQDQARMAPLPGELLAPQVTADVQGGFYDKPVRVALTNIKEAPIYYTLDGSIPTKRSLRYRTPLLIDHTTLLRFRSLLPAFLPGPTATHTYMIKEDFHLPVLSVGMSPASLWNKYSGIYANSEKRGRKWQRAAHAEYFEGPQSRPVRFPAEMKIHGNWSRGAPKKSFQMTYSTAALEAMDTAGLLNSPEIKNPQRTVILRAGATDASYRLGDELFRSIFAAAGGLISRSTPVMVLLNGKPWGLYNIHEKIDQGYLKRRYGEGQYELVSQERSPRVLFGDGRGWKDLIDFFTAHDLTDDEEFRRAAQLVDIDNFTDHRLFNIYAGNLDWPHNNDYAFRKIGQGERWRWISWDADETFQEDRSLEHNTLLWASRDGLRHDLSYGGKKSDAEEFLTSTLILRSLLRNPSYRNYFISRFCDLLNSHLSTSRVEARFTEILDEMEPHLEADWTLWPGSKEAYSKSVVGIRSFIAQRPHILIKHFQDKFHLGQLVPVTLKNDPRAGSLQINSLIPDRYPWTGRYFADSQISLTAAPAQGFEFAGWNDPALGDQSTITVSLRHSLVLEARYRKHAHRTGTPMPTVKTEPRLSETVS